MRRFAITPELRRRGSGRRCQPAATTQVAPAAAVVSYSVMVAMYAGYCPSQYGAQRLPQLPQKQPKAAEGARSAAAFWAVNCSVSLCNIKFDFLNSVEIYGALCLP
jgi:hypothetical protein